MSVYLWGTEVDTGVRGTQGAFWADPEWLHSIAIMWLPPRAQAEGCALLGKLQKGASIDSDFCHEGAQVFLRSSVVSSCVSVHASSLYSSPHSHLSPPLSLAFSLSLTKAPRGMPPWVHLLGYLRRLQALGRPQYTCWRLSLITWGWWHAPGHWSWRIRRRKSERAHPPTP